MGAKLLPLLDQASFAFLVLTAEDERTDGTLHARENVVHEVGLFPRGDITAKFEEIRRVLEREDII